MVRLAAWVIHAYRRYHARQITLGELQRTVHHHRTGQAPIIGVSHETPSPPMPSGTVTPEPE